MVFFLTVFGLKSITTKKKQPHNVIARKKTWKSFRSNFHYLTLCPEVKKINEQKDFFMNYGGIVKRYYSRSENSLTGVKVL